MRWYASALRRFPSDVTGTQSSARIHALIALYRSTHYDAALPGHGVATLRVGAHAPAMVCGWIGADAHAYFVTACNPHSRVLSPPENECRLVALRTRLRRHSHRFLEGVGHVPGAPWHEPSLFVAGIGRAEIDTLAQDFSQNAVVVIAPPGVARLRLYRPEWRDACAAMPDLEWPAS
jgi:hypothetical protein